MNEAGVEPDVLHTSLQTRAIRTANLALNAMDRLWLPVQRPWRLNERHYGDLTGHNKPTAAEFGEQQVHEWRRSYDTPPPPIKDDNPFNPNGDAACASLPVDLVPASECLKDVVERVVPYFYDSIVPDLEAGHVVLVAAHGNSLRALVKHLDGISDADIAELNLPTGVPFVYELDDAFHPTESKPRRCNGRWAMPTPSPCRPPPSPPRPAQDRRPMRAPRTSTTAPTTGPAPDNLRSIRAAPIGSRHKEGQHGMPTPTEPSSVDLAHRPPSTSPTSTAPAAPLVLVNVWDAATVGRAQAVGAKAIATSSVAINAALGQPDTNAGDVDLVFAAIARISASARAGHRRHRSGLRPGRPRVVQRPPAVGAVGCNLEDSDHRHAGALVDADRLRPAASPKVRGRGDRGGRRRGHQRPRRHVPRAGDRDRDPEAVVDDTIERGSPLPRCRCLVRLPDPADRPPTRRPGRRAAGTGQRQPRAGRHRRRPRGRAAVPTDPRSAPARSSWRWPCSRSRPWRC